MDIGIEKIITTFVKIRDTKEALYREYKAKNAELEEEMAVLKQKLLELSKETGATSFSTPEFVAYRKVNSKYWTNDWGSFYEFMLEQKAPQLLERRIQQTNMKEFLENNPDIHPPGLNLDSEYDFIVKRK